MKNKTWIVTVLAVLVTATAGLSAGYAAGRETALSEISPEAAELTAGAASEKVPAPAHTPKYVLKGYQGKLAVFIGNKTEPELQFEVYLHHLPDVDRMRLEEGIAVDDYQELLSLIEDFTS
ncbi:MAG TPA: hypothetical protein IAB57_01335 [Candidatus Fimivivens faecavium]|nr:hypothetical protein [Candidatus Fimivivens faecavium]